MTREEKIAELINIRDNFNYTLAPREVFDDAIKALEQEPCDDAISRQAVLDLIADYDLSMGQVVKGIHALPSVRLQEKTGYWIPQGIYDEWGNECSYKCSECGERNFYPDNYCHNCGTKMVKSQEVRSKNEN